MRVLNSPSSDEWVQLKRSFFAPAIFVVIIWLLLHWGVVSLESGATVQWLGLFALSGVLAIGMSWSHVRRRLSGQYDTDEIDG